MILRRRFLLSLSVALLAPQSLVSLARSSVSPKRLYIGTNGRGPGNGIFTADWNAATGEIGPVKLAAEVVSPTFLAQFRRPDGETSLYAVTEADHGEARVSA